jgi:hypothetical protein
MKTNLKESKARKTPNLSRIENPRNPSKEKIKSKGETFAEH